MALDLGNGSLGPLQQVIELEELDAVAVSHLHPDHCVDLCSLHVARTYRPGYAPEARLPVWGPPGISRRIAGAYGADGPESIDSTLDFREVSHLDEITVGPFRVVFFSMTHPTTTFGMRVEADGRTLAYTGDTDDGPWLRDLLRDCDLALMDCAYVEGRDTARGVHLTGLRAARAAVEATGVRRLMLTHLPPWNDPQICLDQAAQIWPGAVELCRPLTTYHI
ncbi:hypothetical protein KEM60_02781 [Austwickia sp. TVS 96-490-7B]|nr:hypothetical protein [Austwickia sp. TVS 96-490-7B]